MENFLYALPFLVLYLIFRKRRKKNCYYCNGTGWISRDQWRITCTKCKGKGIN